MSLSYHPTSGALLGGPSDTPESSSSGLAGFPASPLRPTAIAIDSSVGVPSVTFSANGSRLLESPAVQESGAIAGTQLAAWSKVVEEVALEMSRKESENKRLKSRLRVTEWQLKQAEEKEGGLSFSPKSFGSGGMAREQRDGSIAGLDDSEIDQRFSEVAASFSGLERRPSLVVHRGTPLDSLVEEFGGAASGSRNQLQAELGLQKLATGTDVYAPESSMEPSPPSTPLSAMDGIDLLGSGSVCHQQYREGEDGQSPRNNSDDSGHYRNGRNPTSGSYQQSQIQRPTSSHRNYSRFDDHPRSPLRQQSQNHTHSHQHQNDANQDALVWTGRVTWLEEQLRHRDRLLAAAHVKEAQLQSEKRSLAARAAELRMVYDQQQRCMADAAAKALQYRADLVDENMKLSRALEIAERDRAIFVSGLMPLLAEFGLHPPSSDAAAILHSMKMVMQRLLSELSVLERQGDQQESISSSRHPDSWALSSRQIERHEQGLIGQKNMQFLSIRSADSGATTSESLQQGSGQPSDVWWSARDNTTRPAVYHAPLSPSWVRADGQAEVGYAPSYQASQVSASPVAVETTSRPPSSPPMLPGFNPISISPLHQNANHGMGPHSHLNAPPQAEAASHKHVLPAQQQVLAPATSGIPDQPSAGLEVKAGGMPTDAAGTSSLVEVVVTPMNGTTFDSQGVMARNEPSQGPIRSGSLEDVQRTGSWNSRSPGISSTGTEVSFKEWPLRTTQPGQEDQRAEIGPQSPRAASPLREQSQQRQQQQQQQQHQHQHQHQHQQQQQQQQQHSPPWRQHSPPPQQQQPQQSPTSPAGRPGRQAPLGADDDRSNGSGPADGGNSAQGEVDSRSVGGSRGSRRGRGAEGNGRDRVDDSERYQGSPGGSQWKERDRRESRRSSSVGPKVEPKEGRRSRGGERSRASSSAKAEKARRGGPSRRDNLPTVKEDDDRATTSEDPEDEDEIDDLLPAVAGLRIVGDASLGGKLTACGNSINGTSKCIFQWVRHYMDGSSGSIHGAQDSDYLVTADDAHCLISIDCLPMDDCDRQGQVVSAFANNKNWIMLDPAMQTEFTVIQSQGVASFECNCKQQDHDESFQSASYHSYGETTQPYTFTFVMKRASFSLKRNKKTELKEQYGPSLTVEIPVGQARICIVHLNDGKRIELELPDSRRRDILVLSLREFIKKALFEIRPEKKKNRGFLFRGK